MKESTYCFIDSSNLFYGGIGRLAWKVDYEKLYIYLKKKYKVKKVLYYTGIEAHGFEVELKSTQPYPVERLLIYLNSLYRKEKEHGMKELLKRDIARTKFLVKIQSFGYILRLKPTKHIKSYDGTIKTKANCDVDLTFDLMRMESKYYMALIFSGDGDFEILFRYLKERGKNFLIFGHTRNTAYIIKNKYTKHFREFSTIQSVIERK